MVISVFLRNGNPACKLINRQCILRRLIVSLLSPYTIEHEGPIHAHNAMLSDFTNPLSTSSMTTLGAMTSYHFAPLDDTDTGNSPSACTHLHESLSFTGNARVSVPDDHDVADFQSVPYAQHVGQTNGAPHTDLGLSFTASIPHPTVVDAWSSVSPFADADAGSDFLTGPLNAHGDDQQDTLWLNHLVPTNSIHDNHVFATNAPKYKLVQVTEHGIALFYCFNLITGDFIGPVDVTGVTDIQFSASRFSSLVHGEPSTGNNDDTRR